MTLLLRYPLPVLAKGLSCISGPTVHRIMICSLSFAFFASLLRILLCLRQIGLVPMLFVWVTLFTYVSLFVCTYVCTYVLRLLLLTSRGGNHLLGKCEDVRIYLERTAPVWYQIPVLITLWNQFFMELRGPMHCTDVGITLTL